MEQPSWSAVDEKVVRRPPRLHGTALLALSFSTLGICYADLGTSPLYTLNGIWPASKPVPSNEDVIGGVSAIFWAMTLLPFLKYTIFALHFGTDEGEGGTFALFHGIFPPKVPDYEEDRQLTADFGWKAPSTSTTSSIKMILDRLKWVLLAWSLFGTSLTFADGMLTPAVSVTSAVSGIALTVPSLTNDINSISVGILVVFFLIQRFGTAKISYLFSPITFVWLLLMMVTGIYNTVAYPGIYRAIDPSRAVLFFVRTKQYDLLAGVLLALTGCEAMFANLGQFNRLSIQLSFGAFVYPACIFAYFGQGAQLIVHGESVINNIFFATIPGGAGRPLYWVIYVSSILATLVASQTIVTSTFSLFQQVINMKSLPPLRLRYTSETLQGQVYIPAVNWILCAGTIIFVLIFKDLAKLTNAFGFAVATVMFVTTTLVFIQIPYVKHLPWALAVAWLIFFGFLDGLFWGAALTKVPHGAWVPLLVGFVVTVFMVFWTWAKGLEDKFDGLSRRKLRHFISMEVEENVRFTPANPDSNYCVEVVDADGNVVPEMHEAQIVEEPKFFLDAGEQKVPLPRVSTMAIFHKFSAGKGIPHTFYGFLKQWPALPRVVVFLSVRIMPIAHVPKEERYRITKVRTLPGFYGATYMKGFRDDFNVESDTIAELITALESRVQDEPSEVDKAIKEVKLASKNTTHLVPHYHAVARPILIFGAPIVNWIRKLLIETFYRSISYMFPETVTWLHAAEEIVHVGIVAEI